MGSVVGPRGYVESFLEKKLSKGKKELEHLSKVAMTTTGSKWIYLARATSNIDHLLAALEEVLRCKFLPAITKKNVSYENLCNLMVL